jgi:hypothetical protein
MLTRARSDDENLHPAKRLAVGAVDKATPLALTPARVVRRRGTAEGTEGEGLKGLGVGERRPDWHSTPLLHKYSVN